VLTRLALSDGYTKTAKDYHLSCGCTIMPAWTRGRSGEPVASGWQLIGPDGEYADSFWTKRDAKECHEESPPCQMRMSKRKTAVSLQEEMMVMVGEIIDLYETTDYPIGGGAAFLTLCRTWAGDVMPADEWREEIRYGEIPVEEYDTIKNQLEKMRAWRMNHLDRHPWD